MRLTLVQMSLMPTKKENLNKIINEIDTYGKESDLIIFPEMCMGRKTPEVSLCDMAEDIETGEFSSALRTAAKRNKTAVCACLWETSGENRVYNTAVVYSAEGEIIARYRKLHLFDALSVRESDDMLAGEELPPVFELCGVRCALSICYDLRFPEVYRNAAFRGAELFIIPAAWYGGEMKKEHLVTLTAARAIENTAYAACACLCKGEFTGYSSVVDPFGRALSSAEETENTLSAEINTYVVDETRTKLPSLANFRRHIFYSGKCS